MSLPELPPLLKRTRAQLLEGCGTNACLNTLRRRGGSARRYCGVPWTCVAAPSGVQREERSTQNVCRSRLLRRLGIMLHLTPPAMPGLPILGNLLTFNRDPYGLL